MKEETEKFPISEEELLEAIESLNDSGLSTAEKVNPYEGKGKNKTVRPIIDLISDFMTATEGVPEEKEDDLSDEVTSAYNVLSDYIRNKAKEEKKAKEAKKATKAEKKEKKVKTDKEKDPAKVARGKALAESRKNKGPSNIEFMRELVGEGKSDKEILKAFSKRYADKDADFVEKRVKIYKKIVLAEDKGGKAEKKAKKGK